MEPESYLGKIGLTLGLVSGALSMLAVGLLQLGRRPELATWGVLLLLVAAACYVGGLLTSLLGLSRDDTHTYAKAGLVLAIILAFPLLPVWLGAINLVISGTGGR